MIPDPFNQNELRWMNYILFIPEIIFIVDIILRFFLAYDEQGDANYEFDVFKTSKRFVNSSEFKIDLFVWIPWGALGLLHTNHHMLRILWAIKLQRVFTFLLMFDYRFYHPILKSIQINRINRIQKSIENKKASQRYSHNMRIEEDTIKLGNLGT